jgi:hypothetical protein
MAVGGLVKALRLGAAFQPAAPVLGVELVDVLGLGQAREDASTLRLVDAFGVSAARRRASSGQPRQA